MANEIQVRAGLTIRKGELDYRSSPTAFNADMSGAGFGPSPGAIVVTQDGTDVDLSQLTKPGIVWIANLEADDAGNYVEYGIYDPETGIFAPWGEVRPGEFWQQRLSRNFGTDYVETGTGTSSATNRMRIKSRNATCNVRVDCFED